MKREWWERQKETKMNEDALIERRMKWKRNEKSFRDESKTWNTWWLLFGKEYLEVMVIQKLLWFSKIVFLWQFYILRVWFLVLQKLFSSEIIFPIIELWKCDYNSQKSTIELTGEWIEEILKPENKNERRMHKDLPDDVNIGKEKKWTHLQWRLPWPCYQVNQSHERLITKAKILQ